MEVKMDRVMLFAQFMDDEMLPIDPRAQKAHDGKAPLRQELIVLIHQHPPSVVFQATHCDIRDIHFNATQAFYGVYVQICDSIHDTICDKGMQEAGALQERALAEPQQNKKDSLRCL
jgi:hypothetical protein